MGPPYHARYLGGDTVRVWRELIELGPGVYDDPVYPDALAVCREVVRRAASNLHSLYERLMALGYVFADPGEALVAAGADAEAGVRDFETQFGELPLVARIWYRTFHSVNFAQAADQRRYLGPEWPPPIASDVSGLGSHPVLRFQSLNAGRAMWREMRDQVEERIAEARATGGSYDAPEFGRFLPLGGWASNCEPIGFPIPTRGIDAVVFNDGGGDAYFVDALRTAFHWGGFPFWRHSLVDSQYSSPQEHRPNFAAVLPKLRAGLLEL